MAQLGQAFDSSQHDDMNSGYDPIPAGVYPAKVVESELKNTSAGTGKYIKLKFQILQGEFKGRYIWTNLNIINPSPVAVEIAQKELATLCRAVGKGVIQDTQELHGIPIDMKVKIKPAKGDYPAGNEPCGYAPINTMKKDKGAQSTTAGDSGDGFPEGDFEEDKAGATGGDFPGEDSTSQDGDPGIPDDVPWED